MNVFEDDVRKVGVTSIFKLYSIGDIIARFGVYCVSPSCTIERYFLFEGGRGFFSYESVGDVSGVFGTAW